ncbi:hypothetical protein BT93_D2132 [Corymbia citriodora subsp. variegata]|nr:hypothetical protein BT93_D2132 [Corymbia citriodora subsp. variegata]
MAEQWLDPWGGAGECDTQPGPALCTSLLGFPGFLCNYFYFVNLRRQNMNKRRTTAHDNQLANRRHRKRQKDSQVAGADCNPSVPGKVPRGVQRRNELKGNPDSGFCTSGDGTRRLRTHLWHAKRFAMTKLWGFYLPLGLQGREGSRALVKWYKQGVVIHDASYHFAVQLEGLEDSLISVLDRVLVPSPSAHSMDMSHSFLSGVTYGRAVRVSCSSIMLEYLFPPIAPVIHMWRHLAQHNTGKVQQDCTLNVEGVPDNIDGSVPFRRICVWIHVSAFTEGFDALKSALHEDYDISGSKIGSFICCSSLEGHHTKLEVMGSGAFKLIQKILHPVKHILEKPFQLKKHSSIEASMDQKKVECDLLHNKDSFPSHAILSLVVKDPREYKDEESVNDSKRIDLSTVGEVLSHEHHGLWDAGSGIRTLIEENILHTERYKKCMDFLCLDNAFWIPLISKGAHAREKHWIANNAYLPYFPLDYPDCNVYTSLMAIEAAASHSKADCCPPAVRALKVPVPPPCSTICPFDKAYTAGVDTLISSERSTSNSSSLSSLTNSQSGVTSSRLQDHMCGFRGSVVRTNKELTCFLEDNHGGHSFLLCYKMISDRSFLKALKDKSNVGRLAKGISRIMARHDLCFLRVILLALKEADSRTFCEVNNLAHLREEQWTEMSLERRKKEIYVLGGTMRSSAYRLASATIVLEQRENDLEFI